VPISANWLKLPGIVTHTFTHFHLELTVWRAVAAEAVLEDSRWVPRDRLHREALPTVMRKVVAHVLDQG
jgi:A/G-specific adenine glycosylase